MGAWRFAIDVGGTFTDVLAYDPAGREHVVKLLSTGRLRGTVGAGSTPSTVHDPLRAAGRGDLWVGYALTCVGDAAAPRRVVSSTPDGRLQLDGPQALPAGASYELFASEPAPIVAIRTLMQLRLHEPIGAVDVRLGSTRGTNALLERRGAATVFVTTAGFGDVLRIGYQDRPKLFELHIRKPQPLFEHVIEVDERLAADGSVLRPLDSQRAVEQLRLTRAAGARSAAICLLHACVNDAHERELARIAAQIGFEQVSVSSRVAPTPRLIPRGDTTVVDAYLGPVIAKYVEELRRWLPEAKLRLMTSAGGLVAAESFTAKDAVLSGPAGGVVGCAAVAREAGVEPVIGFDMGGTSTDVCRYAGAFDYQYECEKAGVRIVAPLLAVETVAAGGGSVCRFDGQKLVVGPESAGADPGPACYGRGGPLTLTDVNLFLGRIQANHFPFALDVDAVRRSLRRLADEVSLATARTMPPVALAEGLIAIANASMAGAIKSISTARGIDVRDHALVAFGGAAGQHACGVANLLGIGRVLIGTHAGILSAVGMALADVARHAERPVVLRVECGAPNIAPFASPVAAWSPLLQEAFDEMERPLRDAVRAEGISDGCIETIRSLDIRYDGQNVALTVRADAKGDHVAAFEREHERRYGYVHLARAIEIATARVEVVGHVASAPRPLHAARTRHPLTDEQHAVVFDGAAAATPLFRRQSLAAGDRLLGPAVILDSFGTIVVEPGWTATITERLDLLLEHDAGAAARAAPAAGWHVQARLNELGRGSHSDAPSDTSEPPTPVGGVLQTDEPSTVRATAAPDGTPRLGGRDPEARADPIQLELFHRTFSSIAEQMGAMLRRTALSTNVKERLDFSCAVFDTDGRLVANAPHIPVHLGGMSACVQEIIRRFGELEPGDVVITNDPFAGGSHLPDVTVVTPVHVGGASAPRFFVASRAHHAEIGGKRPGSMAADAACLADEGVLIRPFKLCERGRERFDVLHRLLTSGPYPSRQPVENVADVTAQVAANRRGVELLRETVAQSGAELVTAYTRHIRAASAARVRAALGRLKAGVHEFRDALDDGTTIVVAVRIEADGATFDFTGSGAVHAGCLNANRSIVTSAVLYCLRCLLDEDVPLNDGALDPVTLVIPPGILDPPTHDDPRHCPAVGGGNVETSQRVVDVILGALGLAAASQGTMNNLLIGNERFGYYETIAGGAGAGPGFDGADAVHTHMTNTRLTDPETLESRYPLRLRRFAIRRGSGGTGLHAGGAGVMREIEFLAPVEVSILSQRRSIRPYGLAGGTAGAAGRNELIRANGQRAELPGAAQFAADAGDRLVIETPGGGGYGRLQDSARVHDPEPRGGDSEPSGARGGLVT